MFAGEKVLDFHLRHRRLKAAELLLQVGSYVLAFFVQLDERLQVVERSATGLGQLDGVSKKSAAAQDRLLVFLILPEFRILDLPLDFSQLPSLTVDVKDTPRGFRFSL